VIADFIATKFHPTAFEKRTSTVGVVFPAHNEAATILNVVEPAVRLLQRNLIDDVLVVADRCTDDTEHLARRAGARVVRSDEMNPELGPVQGRDKGDVMWRAAGAIQSDIVVFCDADSGPEFGEHFVLGLAGPILQDRADFVKGHFTKLWMGDGTAVNRPGGRVNNFVAKPLLERFFPALADIKQPLSGEIALRRSLLDRLTLHCDYGVDIGLLIDAWRAIGSDRVAQVDLGTRRNRHQSEEALIEMSKEVIAALLARRWPEEFAMGRVRPPRNQEAGR